MQPDTTPLKLARDITHKLSAQSGHSQPSIEQPLDNDSQETDTAQTESTTDTSLEATATGSEIQVVPLYTPEGSAIKFFCVHPSHPYAMNLVPISTGFQGQVKTKKMTDTYIVSVGLGVICGLSLSLVLFLASRGSYPGTLVFPSSQKPTFPNSNSTWNPRATGLSVVTDF